MGHGDGCGVEYGTPLVDDPDRLAGVRALGVDETAFLAANAKHHTQFVTGMVDVTESRLLDVVQGRSGTVLCQWIRAQPQPWRDGVTVAALDPFRGYATALRTSLPHATRVLDAFHVNRLGFAAVDDVRRRVQQQDLGHRGRKGDPLYSIRRVLRRGHEHLTDVAWDRLLTGLDVGDVDGQVAAAWIAAQDLRLIYRAKTRHDAQRRLHRWLVHCADSDVPELHRLASTIDSWREELLAYFETGGISNGPTEAMNLLIKKIKRDRPRLPQLRQLPTPPPAALRRRLAHSTTNTDQRPATTVDCVEPLNEHVQEIGGWAGASDWAVGRYFRPGRRRPRWLRPACSAASSWVVSSRPSRPKSGRARRVILSSGTRPET